MLELYLPNDFLSFSTSEKSKELSENDRKCRISSSLASCMQILPSLPHVHSASRVIHVIKSSTLKTTFSDIARTSSCNEKNFCINLIDKDENCVLYINENE